MEEVLKNFITHLKTRIHPKLGEGMENKLNIQNEGNLGDYDEIEHEIKSYMNNFFKNANSGDYFEIAKNLYNSYIDNDDENILKSVKFFIRMYSKFQEIKMKKIFYKWRINILFDNDGEIKLGQKNIQNKVQKNKSENKNKISGNNLPMSYETYKSRPQKEQLIIQPPTSTSTLEESNYIKTMLLNKNNSINSDIFQKLYLDSYKKQDMKLLNDELKRMSELEPCTFQPNSKNKKTV
jgi:hypothetical protein